MRIVDLTDYPHVVKDEAEYNVLKDPNEKVASFFKRIRATPRCLPQNGPKKLTPHPPF